MTATRVNANKLVRAGVVCALLVCVSAGRSSPVDSVGEPWLRRDRPGAQLGRDCDLCNLDLPGIIAYQGYPVEAHRITPADGTVELIYYRIPGPRGTQGTDPTRPPVLLQHGLLDSGSTWILNPIESALGFILADNGYDVWLGNNRGTNYSPCASDECWAFSFDDMGLYDMPAAISYILNITGRANLTYIGHSQGTTQAFAGFSTLPHLNDQVNLFVALAPAAYVNNQKSPLVSALALLDVAELIKLFGFKAFLPQAWWLYGIARIFCTGGWFTPLCEDAIFVLCGVDPEKDHNFNQTRAEVYLTHTPSGTSVQNMVHWMQSIKTGTFKMYDFGSSGNQQHYGQDTPPVYNLANVRVPTAVFSGGHDYLADPEDVERLVSELPASTVVYTHFEDDYSHLDFVWGLTVRDRIYSHVLDLLKQYAH